MRLVIDLQGAQGTSRLRGIGRYSRELALAMARDTNGHEVILALHGGFAESAEELTESFAPLIGRDNIHVWWPPAGVGEIHPASAARRDAAQRIRAHALQALRPDLVHVSSMFEGMADDVITRWPHDMPRLPIVATSYDLIPLIRRADYLDRDWARNGLAGWYMRRLQELRLCEGLLAISQSSRQETIDHLGFPAGRVFNIRAGVGAGFRPPPADPIARAALLARYGLRDGFVLFLGAGESRKNESGLIRGYGLLPPSLRDRHQLVIVGRGDPARLRETAAAAGVMPAHLHMVEFIDEADLPGLYAACHLFVLPSLHEGFGLPAAEAMACGAPVLGSNTSSLPEVIGLADALFDPADPASIAACMRHALEDDGFRRTLAAHGRCQAARFTWQDSAQRAWRALERIAAARGEARPPRLPDAALNRRPSLAFVSPLPPQASGIAAYAAELIPVLAEHYAITLVTETGETDLVELSANFPHLDAATFLKQGQRFDRVLYQLGNSPFHAFQLEDLMPAIAGVCTLHDAYLSSLAYWMATRAAFSGGPEAEARLAGLLLRDHGYAALAALERHGIDQAAQLYPLSLAPLRDAIGLIQHSRHGQDIMRQHFGVEMTRQIRLVPMLRALPQPQDRATARQALGLTPDGFVAATFGIIAGSKKPELLLAAWARLRRQGDQLVFVGELVDAGVAELLRGVPDVVVTGRTDDATYQNWLDAADIGVQMRTGSRGETSRAIIDCLAAGLPVIANLHGSAAELPADCMMALPEDCGEAALAAAMATLRDQPDRRAALGMAARLYVAEQLSPRQVARRYADAIEASYQDGAGARSAAAMRAIGRGLAGLPTNAADLADIAVAAAASFPMQRPMTLWIDLTPGQAAPDALARELLSGHPPDLRVLPVRLDGGIFVGAGAEADRLLGLRHRPGAAVTFLPQGGDGLLQAASAALLAPDVRRALLLRNVSLLRAAPGMSAAAILAAFGDAAGAEPRQVRTAQAVPEGLEQPR